MNEDVQIYLSDALKCVRKEDTMKKKLLIAYTVLVLGIMALPFYGLVFGQSGEPIGNEEQAKAPLLQEEGKLNPSFLKDAGDYFEQKMAFRDMLISANTRISSDLLGVSANDQVIVGKNGWLYYADSLDDYQGVNLLSPRALYNVAANVRMMQEETQRQGGSFVFTVAPNKNSLYPQNMPYYSKVKYTDEKNIENLLPYLEKAGVHYVDLFSLFEGDDRVLYHKTDSHWNNQGAAMAYDKILQALNKEHEDYQDMSYQTKKDFTGDLEEMLHPGAPKPEEEIYYDKDFSYTYENKVESTFDPLIDTENKGSKENLLMYRDSFGNALVPFMAEAFEKAKFSRAEPYYLSGDCKELKADMVVVERAERFLKNLAQNPAVLEQPPKLLDQGYETGENDTTLTVGEPSGSYVTLEGAIDKALTDLDTRIFVRLDHRFSYEASPMSIEGGNDYGYRLYLPEERMDSSSVTAEVVAITGSSKATDEAAGIAGEETKVLGRYQVSAAKKSAQACELQKKEPIVTEEKGYTELGKKSAKTVCYHIFNRSGKTIKKLYTAEEGSNDFEKNLLKKGEKLRDDQEFLLHYGKKGKLWIKAVYSDGSEGIFKDMPLSHVKFLELHQKGKKYAYIYYQNEKTGKIKNNHKAVKARVKREEEEARRAAEAEKARKEAEAAQAAAQRDAAAKPSSGGSSQSKPAGKRVVRREKVYDCDGSGNFYYIIYYSDGSTAIQ